MIQAAPAPERRRDRTHLVAATVLLLAMTTACSRNDVPEHAVLFPADDLPAEVLGYARWEPDGERKPVHRVRCGMENDFYVMKAEGRDFVLRVGFWDAEGLGLEGVDFEQADSVELSSVDDELHFYRYTSLRILKDMGAVVGSAESVSGKTPLRSTSTEALIEHREGVELDFEFSCPALSTMPARVAGS